ncbi:hypothetical protein HZA33_03215 [Candidatus Pacearchaeota archaeon]|nr:hypothetical protein [Candidatus Pacearchaeota archaeon]
MMPIEALIETYPRTKLLKEVITQEDLQDKSELFKGLQPKVRDEFRESLIAYMESEEALIEQGHKGKYALYYKDKCIGISDNYNELVKSFMTEKGEHACYCSKIGGGA